ncbi:MAG: flagellar basal body rod protein FlgB [Bryobacterales bacterium]|nr:flagellar basal body rod protein FlgB [Bryobacterales bacterium]
MKSILDLLATRQKLVASNMANLDTPGYRTRDVDFQHELSAALARGASGNTRRASVSPTLVEVEGLAINHDGNNVSLDREAKMLAENAMRFELGSSLLASRFRTIRLAIKEGNS